MTRNNVPNEVGRAPDDRDDNERAGLEQALHEVEDRILLLRNVIVASSAMPDTPNWRQRVERWIRGLGKVTNERDRLRERLGLPPVSPELERPYADDDAPDGVRP